MAHQDIEDKASAVDVSYADKTGTIDIQDADMALQVLYANDVTPEELAAVDDKKFLRTVDLHMLPIVRLPPSPQSLLTCKDVYCHSSLHI